MSEVPFPRLSKNNINFLYTNTRFRVLSPENVNGYTACLVGTHPVIHPSTCKMSTIKSKPCSRTEFPSPPSDHRVNLFTYRRCCSGRKLVDWVVAQSSVSRTRVQVVQIWQALLTEGIIQHGMRVCVCVCLRVSGGCACVCACVCMCVCVCVCVCVWGVYIL